MNFQERLKTQTLLMDGAFGTYCSRKQGRRGVSYELLNLTDPGLVEGIHREYLAAGADAVKTNTFGATPDALGRRLEEVLTAACGNAARASQGTGALIFADLGPVSGDPAQRFKAYREIIDIFLKCGLTHFLFETLESAAGVRQAAGYIKNRCPDAAVIVSFAVDPEGFTRAGLSGRELLL